MSKRSADRRKPSFARGLQRGAVGVTTLVVVAAGPVQSAFAFFTAHRTGSGTAGTGTAQNLTGLSATASISSLIYPGASADLVLKVHNPNSRAVVISAVAASGSATGCTTPAITVSVSSGLSLTVPAGGDLAVTLTNVAAMGVGASTDCQGATISVPLSVTGKLS
jgi:hypothetical protein